MSGPSAEIRSNSSVERAAGPQRRVTLATLGHSIIPLTHISVDQFASFGCKDMLAQQIIIFSQPTRLQSRPSVMAVLSCFVHRSVSALG
jgi:hypothetical protein